MPICRLGSAQVLTIRLFKEGKVFEAAQDVYHVISTNGQSRAPGNPQVRIHRVEWMARQKPKCRADLSRAHFREGRFSCSNLAGADLTLAYFGRADLAGTDLSSANLSEASLRGANFAKANLTNATLIGTDVTRADFSGAHWSPQTFRGLIWSARTWRAPIWKRDTYWIRSSPGDRGRHKLPRR